MSKLENLQVTLSERIATSFDMKDIVKLERACKIKKATNKLSSLIATEKAILSGAKSFVVIATWVNIVDCVEHVATKVCHVYAHSITEARYNASQVIKPFMTVKSVQY